MKNVSKRNLILGGNSSGKTHVLEKLFEEAIRNGNATEVEIVNYYEKIEYNGKLPVYLNPNRIQIEFHPITNTYRELIYLFYNEKNINFDEVNKLHQKELFDEEFIEEFALLDETSYDVTRAIDNIYLKINGVISKGLEEKNNLPFLEEVLAFLELSITIDSDMRDKFITLVEDMQYKEEIYDFNLSYKINYDLLSLGYKSLVIVFAYCEFFKKIKQPVILFLDELVQGLDYSLRILVVNVLREFTSDNNILITTGHDIESYNVFVHNVDYDKVYIKQKEKLVELSSIAPSEEQKSSLIQNIFKKRSIQNVEEKLAREFLNQYFDYIAKKNAGLDISPQKKKRMLQIVDEIDYKNLEFEKYRFIIEKIERFLRDNV